ncbi:hypothetical protein CRG98_042147 [Punica granatum]|uniref:Uncharacterized protein n=1 Tax=Punica granatum TaxID=22663 RepID=A0A2I0I0J9_PUNGR|nr:hypothetical protein CRG98_042147 [Punica granatum]
MPLPCDEGFCFAGRRVLRDSSFEVDRLCIPSGRESESAIILAMRQKGSRFRRPPGNASRIPIGHVWAYRDFPNDALAALSVVQHARHTELLERRTLLPTVLEEGFPLGRLDSIGEPTGDRVGIDNLDTSLGDPLFARCVAPKGVFDLAGLILLSLELAKVKDSKDLTSECIVSYLPRGVVSVAPLFVEGISGWGCPRAYCGRGLVFTQMTESVLTSLAGVAHYGDLKANFNQRDPSLAATAESGCDPFSGQRRAQSLIDARGHAERCVSDHAVMLSVRKKLASVSLAWEGGSALRPRLALPWKKGEGRRWPAREGWHDSPVVRGGWQG